MDHNEDNMPEGAVTSDERTLRDEEFEDLIYVEPSPARVTFSTQDLSIDALVKRLNRKSMLVPQFGSSEEHVKVPGFQRGFVWSKAQMDKFIESLLLGYPVPGIFLVRQEDGNRMLILDGQQRLVTLQRFYAGIHDGREFKLNHVGDEFKGLTYATLDESLQFKLDDSYMQATIVAADGSDEVNDSIFQIFERLNSGGTQLTPHEIRVALYAGPLMDSIESLNDEESWRALFGKKSKRIRDHELIMRILALYTDSASYRRPLKTYLNQFARQDRHTDMNLDSRGQRFLEACTLINREIGSQAFRRFNGSQVNTAQAEALTIAVMDALTEHKPLKDLSAQFGRLLEDADFLKHTGRATADKDAVDTRLTRARALIG